MLKKQIQPRRYQETIFAQATQHNTLVVLPTGLGKTMIAMMLAVHRLQQYPESKILVLAPTKPLVQQHERTFKEFMEMDEEEFTLFTGAIRPDKRAALWNEKRIIFSTPQGLENDILGGKITFDDVSLIVFDEAHRTVGEYSYVFLAKQYIKQARNQRILALTASPGTDETSITEVCEHLGIEEIEVRSAEDVDVKPYVQETDVQWVQVALPPKLLEIRKLLDNCLQQRIATLKEFGAITGKYVNKRTLLGLTAQLQRALAKGEKDFDMMKSLSVAAEALKLHHAIELVDTQGVYALKKYFGTIKEQATKGLSKAVKNIVADPTWKTAEIKTNTLLEENVEHPKLKELQKLVLQHTYQQDDCKMIIFTQYRDQGVKILEALETINVSGKMFVGQAKRGNTGMSQKEQKEILDEFRNGEFSCLIATSVAEEGLDIPKVDVVMFYEPVPSAIRTVQRRGRTGRGEKGKVIVLMTTGTADVGYKWAAHHKEKRMYRAITEVKKKFKLEPKEQKTLLQQFREEKKQQVKVICDYREKASPVMKELLDTAQIELQQLSVGDYQVSDRVVVEYKKVPDFVDSIIDGRLLSQLKSLSQYTRPIILIEGTEDLYSQRKIHPNAIRGMLSTITVSYGMPILWSKSPKETAGLLISLAKREQEAGKDWQYHSAKPLTDDELQEYIVASFPGVGNQLAKPLLARFGSIKGIANASLAELQEVELIGKKKASRIKEIAEREYKKQI
ncbi:MAG: DEAD/DEAH box helicase [Candidatus Woesearchaeota archaeon]|nr:DEAD/DEAH box helicase [Candidatus Woesearchaeota archaeon]